MFFRARHGNIKQAMALFPLPQLELLVDGVPERVALAPAAGGVLPLNSESGRGRKSDGPDSGADSLMHSNEKHHGKLKTLGGVHGHDLYGIGGIFRWRIGLPRLGFAQ